MTAPARPIRHEWFDALLGLPKGNDAGIDVHTIAVAASLVSHMNRDGLAWPSTRLIEAEAKCSRYAVIDRITRLERAGWLKVDRRPRGANRYQATGASHAPDSQSGASHAPEGRGRRSGAWEPTSGASGPLSGASEHPSGASGVLSGASHAPEQENPRRGEPVNPAPYGAALPDGRAPEGGGHDNETRAVIALVRDITGRLRDFEHKVGIDPNADDVLVDAFEDAVDGEGQDKGRYWDSEGAERAHITPEAQTEIRAVCADVDRWLQLEAGTYQPEFLSRRLMFLQFEGKAHKAYPQAVIDATGQRYPPPGTPIPPVSAPASLTAQVSPPDPPRVTLGSVIRNRQTAEATS